MLKDAPEDTPVRKLVRRLLIKICGNDYPRQQVLYMIAGGGKGFGLLRLTNVSFARASLSNSRKLKAQPSEDGTVVEASPLDRYGKKPQKYAKLTLYEWLRRESSPTKPVVPLLSGAHMWYSNPPSIEYCESMIRLHTVWSDLASLPRGEAACTYWNMWKQGTAEEGFIDKRVEPHVPYPPFPKHLQLEISKQTRPPPQSHYEEGDEFEYDDAEPEWLDLLGARSGDIESLLEGTFDHDNFTQRASFDQALHATPHAPGCEDYASDECRHALRHPDRWWARVLEEEKRRREASVDLGLGSKSPWHANAQQRKPIVLLLYALYTKFHTSERRLPDTLHELLLRLQREGRLKGALGRRVLLLGKPGSGKSFVLICCTTLTRMIVNLRAAALIGAPTGIAAFVAGGCTWHSSLGVPVGPRFTTSFAGQGGSAEKQARLRALFAALGDETSLTGRTLFGWVAHGFRVNVADGRGSDEPDAGEHLPFWLQAGDWYQADPVLDTTLLNDDHRNANSNYGRQVFELFKEDVIVLDTVVRQDDTQVQLRRLLNHMREGASASTYDADGTYAYVQSRQLGSLQSAAERALYELPGQGTLCCFPTWEEAWNERNQRILMKINAGYDLPSGEHVDGRPVYKILATNSGRHARAKNAHIFVSLPGSTYAAHGLQIRLTINLFGEIGQAWGLVNGAIGTIVEVIYPTIEAAADPHAIPLVVAHFEEYRGPAFCTASTGRTWTCVGTTRPTGTPLSSVFLADALGRKLDASGARVMTGATIELDADEYRATCVGTVRTFHFVEVHGAFFRPSPSRPNLVLLPPVEREGDCRCKCKRRSACFRVCEGTTTHSVEGITVGAQKQVKRIGISLGDKTVEGRARGLSYVAQSRPESTSDFAYLKPVSLERLAAIGSGKSAAALHAAMRSFESNQSTDADTLMNEGFYEPFLHWAEDFALHEHGIPAPWAADVQMADATAADNSSLPPRPPLPLLDAQLPDEGVDEMQMEPPPPPPPPLQSHLPPDTAPRDPVPPAPPIESRAARKRPVQDTTTSRFFAASSVTLMREECAECDDVEPPVMHFGAQMAYNDEQRAAAARRGAYLARMRSARGRRGQ